MKRRKLARLGAILFVIGLVPLTLLILANYLGDDVFIVLPFLAPVGLVGSVGFILLFVAWVMPPERECPTCGAAIPKASAFCSKCGKPLPSA